MQASVVVPTRNRSTLLATTLRSVLRQREVDLEVIVVDEASSDATAEVVSALGDPRLRRIHHAVPLGPNAARNRGGHEARGEWLAFIDDDDLWAPDKLVRQLRAAEASGREWVYGGSVNVNDRLEVVHGMPPPSPDEVVAALPHHNAIPASASNVVIRRETFARENGFNEDLRTCEEWDLWLRLVRGGPPAWVRSPLVAYRMHASNAILDVAAIIEGARLIEQLHATTVDWGRFHRWLAQSSLRSGRRRDALYHYWRAVRAGRAREAVADLAWLTRELARRRLRVATEAPRRRVDLAWETEAREWLRELLALDVSALGGQR